jgi:hypothetical protein
MSLKLRLDEFAHRQFDDPSYPGTRIASMSKEQFMERVNELTKDAQLKEGFVTNIFFVNSTDMLLFANTSSSPTLTLPPLLVLSPSPQKTSLC